MSNIFDRIASDGTSTGNIFDRVAREDTINQPVKLQPIEEAPTTIGAWLNEPLKEVSVVGGPQKEKTWGEVVKHGVTRAGVLMTKQLAGLAQQEAEIGGKIREWAWEKTPLGRKPEYLRKIDEHLKDWSDTMLTGVEGYYNENPEEAIQITPDQGYLNTLGQYVFEPKNLAQGLIESAPLILEGILGGQIAGAGAGIVAMATPISGEVYADARKEGTDPLPALGQAMLTGVGEATIEQWTLGRKLGLAKNFKKIVSKGLPKVLWEGTKLFFRGTAEEGSQEFNRNFWQWVFTDRSQAWTENVAEAAAAGGPMELAMGGAFAGAGAVGVAVSPKQQIQRVDNLRKSVNENEQLSDEAKAEINAELDKAIEGPGAVAEEVAPAEAEAEPTKEPMLPEIKKEVDQYDALIEKVQAGDKQAAGRLTNLVQGFSRPTYESLLERVQEGDQHAMELIDAGFYQGGKPFGVAETRPAAPETPPAEIAAPVVAEVQEPEAKPPRLTRKKALKLGHDIPKALEWDEAQRRDFMQETVGKQSMKGMTPKEMRTLVGALQGKLREAGLEYTPTPSPVDELVSTLETTKKVTELEPSKELNRGAIRKLGRRIKSGAYSFVTGLERMERFFESLDGHKAGAFTENIWRRVKSADELSTENANQDLTEFQEYLAEQDVDPTIWLGKTEQIGDTKWRLTPFQRIGAYMLSLNKNGRRQLVEGMRFSENDLAQIIESMTPQEKTVAEWLLERYEQQWGVIKQVAAQSGLDPAKLKKELHYSPIMRTDADLEAQEDFLSGLSNAFTGELYDPEHKFLEPRKPSARGKVEIDAAVLYMHNIARTQRFLQFAPVANDVGRILNNRKFKAALNDRTYGQGSKLVNKWMQDAVRGTVIRGSTALAKGIALMRRNAIVYAIGYNIPSSLRQALSMSNAVAVDKAMLLHVPANIIRASTPSGYRQMEEFVYARSLDVKNANFDRDLRAKAGKAELKKKLRGKQPWSQKALRWIRWMDKHTRVVAWKSLYDTGMGKFNDEQKAIDYADKWIGRTQPMAHTKDLPHFFRGSEFEQLLTTFQNQVNNNANFYIYDILGAKKAGEISTTEAGYRVMFSYVLPAVLFGMIGRGGLPKDWKDIAVDLATYPIAGVVVLGRWITRMIKGWDNSSTIAEAGPEEAGKLVGAIKRLGKPPAKRWATPKEKKEKRAKDIRDIIKYAATTIGAITGWVPAQAVRTTEGALDLAAGKTEDPRRLIYSEWALAQGKKEKKSTRRGGAYLYD